MPPLEENSERNILLDANPSPVLLDLRVREEQVRSVPAKKSFSSLILPPTARSRQQSRGLHPVGALSVPPLEWYPLGTVRPTRVTAKQQKRHVPGVKKFRVISYSMQDQLQITPKKNCYKVSLRLLRGPVLSLLPGLKAWNS